MTIVRRSAIWSRTAISSAKVVGWTPWPSTSTTTTTCLVAVAIALAYIYKINNGENLDIKIVNSTDKKMRDKYVKFLFQKMHRKQGLLERDCDRMIRNDRVIWSSCMVECGDADAMVTGNTRRYSQSLEKIKKVIPPREGEIMFGLNMVVSKGKTVFIGDTSVNEYPSSEELADIAVSAARVVRLFGFFSFQFLIFQIHYSL